MPPIVIDLLFFVAGAIFVAVICFIKKNHESKITHPSNQSEFISWQEAQNLMNDYSKHPIYCKDESGTIVPLKGFMLESNDINEIINFNRNIQPGEIVSQVMISFGSIGSFEKTIPGTEGSIVYPNLKVIINGVKKVGEEYILLIPTNQSDFSDSDKSSICDHASPCPPNCPKPPIITTNPPVI